MWILELLPDEILLRILKYLNSFDALYSFMKLNTRFENLLIAHKREINLSEVSYQQFLYYFEHLLPNINEILYAMKLGSKKTPGQLGLFMSKVRTTNQFTDIETLTIVEPKLNELTFLLKEFANRLEYLSTLSLINHTIDDSQYLSYNNLITQQLFTLNTLQKCSIYTEQFYLNLLGLQIISTSLVDLELSVHQANDFLHLLNYIPNIENLKITIGWWNHDRTCQAFVDKLTGVPLQKIKLFHLHLHSIILIEFERFNIILKKVLNNSSTLKNFSFSMKSYKSDHLLFIDGDAWQTILSNFSSLEKVHLDIDIIVDEQIGQNYSLDKFCTQYWLKHKWQFIYYFINKRQLIVHSIPYENHYYKLQRKFVSSTHDLPLKFNGTTSKLTIYSSECFNQLLFDILPFINCLSISYSKLCEHQQEIKILHRLVELHLQSFFIDDNQYDLEIFLKKLTNIQWLYLNFENQHLSSNQIISKIKQILSIGKKLRCLNVEFVKPISIEWTVELNENQNQIVYYDENKRLLQIWV
ncbi:unnamed protein product [Didymodactylos carnosus]|uniref:F-box domain-containing protein n=1 Tax=Didymodactylos carnosus TaxID=1234261 RepID=A0A815C4V6_9BILA|nr:unnamed protein product [Didymodactylos carnosus]